MASARLPPFMRRAMTVAVVVLGLSAGAREPFHLPADSQAPAFEVPRLGGGKVSLAQLKGHWVVLDFWASWCPPCRDELPWLNQLAKKYEPAGVVFLAMNTDEGPQQKELAIEFAKTVPGLERFVVLSPPALKDTYRVDGIPTLYVIDPEGKVYASAEGRLPEAAVDSMLARVTKKR